MTKLAEKRSANLRRLFNPESIVVIGASGDPAKAGSQALSSLRTFAGQVMVVHPREATIQGYPCHKSVEKIPAGIDLAILAVPAKACVELVAELAARDVGGVFIISGGFGESGEEGAVLQRQLARTCVETGIRLLGPNTSGFIAPHVPVVASFVPGVEQLAHGRVAVIAQSGGVNLSIAFLLEHLGEGISLAVGLGNAIDVTAADVLAMLGDDAQTAAIALHLEGVFDGRQLYDTLRSVTRRKPVVALVAGKADIGEFAVSHTGNLLGSRQRTVAALVQAGAVVVDTTEELAQASAALSYGRLPAKSSVNVALITGQAGPGLLIADSLKSAGLALPELSPPTIATLEGLLPPMTYLRNPIDTGRPGATFPQVIETAARDPEIDAVLVFGLNEPTVLDPVQALRPALSTGKPVIFGTLGTRADLEQPLRALGSAGIPSTVGPERLALAATALAADARAQHQLAMADLSRYDVLPRLAGSFDESRAKALIATYGIEVPQGILCDSADEAMSAFRKLGKPVVVKIVSSDIVHKTEVGGVIVGISDERGMRAALDKIAAIPTKEPCRVLVETMADEGVELIVGGIRDDSWGPIVLVGMGGIFAEALADSAVRLAPIATTQAEDMLDALRGKRVLEGFRGLPRVNRQAVANVMVSIGRLMCEHPEISEIEINPLRVGEQDAVALDALVVVG